MDSALVPSDAVKEMAQRIAEDAPTLADLTPEQLEQIAKLVITQKLTHDLTTAAHLAGIDFRPSVLCLLRPQVRLIASILAVAIPKP